jgi:hypothetical protein
MTEKPASRIFELLRHMRADTATKEDRLSDSAAQWSTTTPPSSARRDH